MKTIFAAALLVLAAGCTTAAWHGGLSAMCQNQCWKSGKSGVEFRECVDACEGPAPQASRSPLPDPKL